MKLPRHSVVQLVTSLITSRLRMLGCERKPKSSIIGKRMMQSPVPMRLSVSIAPGYAAAAELPERLPIACPQLNCLSESISRLEMTEIDIRQHPELDRFARVRPLLMLAMRRECANDVYWRTPELRSTNERGPEVSPKRNSRNAMRAVCKFTLFSIAAVASVSVWCAAPAALTSPRRSARARTRCRRSRALPTSTSRPRRRR